MKILWRSLFLWVAAALLLACQLAPTPVEETMEPNHYIVGANTQIRVGDLRIGMGNIRQSEYVDATGATVKGWTASLAISVRDDPAASQTIRVHAGQQFTVGKYALQVLDVSSAAQEVKLIVTEITPVPSAPSP